LDLLHGEHQLDRSSWKEEQQQELQHSLGAVCPQQPQHQPQPFIVPASAAATSQSRLEPWQSVRRGSADKLLSPEASLLQPSQDLARVGRDMDLPMHHQLKDSLMRPGGSRIRVAASLHTADEQHRAKEVLVQESSSLSLSGCFLQQLQQQARVPPTAGPGIHTAEGSGASQQRRGHPHCTLISKPYRCRG
jgi:hypothetical protein